MKKIIFALICLIFIQSKCLATSNIELQNITQQQVIQLLSKKYIKNNIQVSDLTESSFSCTEVLKDFSNMFLYGSSASPYPEKRSYFSTIQDGKNVILQVSIKMVINPNSGFQKMQDMPFEESKEVNKLKNIFNGYYTYGFEYACRKRYLIVTRVDYNLEPSVKEQGLNYHDKIIAINDEPISSTYTEIVNNINPILFNTPQQVKLTVKNKRKDTPKEIYMKRIYVKPITTQL